MEDARDLNQLVGATLDGGGIGAPSSGHNVFLNDQRARFPATEFNETQDAPSADGAERAGQEMDVERALQMLSVRQQAVFDLHYKKGMTHDEVASALELPLGTVKSRMFTGLSRLRELLDESGHEQERWNAPEFTS